MSPGELLRQHAYRKQLLSMTPRLSGGPGGMVSLSGSKEDSKVSEVADSVTRIICYE